MDVRTLMLNSANASLAVIGDICLDLYYFINKEHTEISVETGLKTNSVYSLKQELGGAANVAVNCRHLGANKVDLYGIIGRDPHGVTVQNMLGKEGIGVRGVCVQKKSWLTHVYHKIYEDNNELPRYDIGNFNFPSESSINKVLTLFENQLSTYQCVIINEQVLQGIHSETFQKRLNAVIQRNQKKILWFADCRNLNDIYQGVIHKLNNKEAKALYQANLSENNEPDDLTHRELAEWLYHRWNKPVVVTRGENGALVHDGSVIHEIMGLHFMQPVDPVGAGDAFLAGMTVACASGASLRDAAEIGNFSAGVALKKLFETGHPSAEEVIGLAKDPDYRYEPELAINDRLATYAEDTEIEIIRASLHKVFSGTYPKVTIFDHDGTISTLRQGWEEIMESVMVRCVTGSAFLQLPTHELKAVHDQAKALIEQTTGIQTIIQMHELKKLVESNRYVPASEILTPEQYKSIYNKELLEKIGVKINKFKSGMLSLEDLTMKDAVAFLTELHEHGTRLYLASGTDQDDVREEAKLLGYADLFDGGIYGSVGDICNDPKRLVIRKILADVNAFEMHIDPSECVVFGDGPVEMREAKKHGMIAVGLLSDERQRFGKNKMKRERLILAGADLLLPDFSWKTLLAQWLGWE